ncbi:hypothetical protein [Pseudomonas sp. GOM6]|uniref:hypothetical protein n=1 Tax=Pseudomonas sp. GOM6 TaxID=3036944 RepID=UPI0024099E84|nr:hypothetical protein [Pseudomonas sp. GOM6]MDG1580875.1 hypothetical protein [Pseudomonas sp. GOM6]
MFYFGLSTPAAKEQVLSILQPWLEGAEGELKGAVVDVVGVIKSPFNADYLEGECFYKMVVVFGLLLALRGTSSYDAVTLSDAGGKVIEFDDEFGCRSLLRSALTLSDERVDEAWSILADFGVMRRKLDLSVLGESPSASDDEFCL